MTSEHFEVDGNRLVVHADLHTALAEELRKFCDRMLSESGGELTIDLTAVKYIDSMSMGVLTYVWVQASGRKREIAFVVSPEIAVMLEKTGLNEVLHYRVAGPSDD
jgi:anti-anti-sigma factor